MVLSLDLVLVHLMKSPAGRGAPVSCGIEIDARIAVAEMSAASMTGDHALAPAYSWTSTARLIHTGRFYAESDLHGLLAGKHVSSAQYGVLRPSCFVEFTCSMRNLIPSAPMPPIPRPFRTCSHVLGICLVRIDRCGVRCP